jgi:hypothetical protein
MIYSGRNAQVAVLKHPLHLVGQPCTHTTARLPGPFATEQLKNPDKFNFIWSTLENRPGANEVHSGHKMPENEKPGNIIRI